MSSTGPVSPALTPSLGGRVFFNPESANVNAADSVHTDPVALRNLIVNYLPPQMNEAQLCQLFGQFGIIESVKIIYDKFTYESRGYGFVKFKYFFSATYALSCLNRYEIGGKRLKVAYSNVEEAKRAYDELKQSTTAFTDEQRASLEQLYRAQILAAEQGAVGSSGITRAPL